MTARSAIAWFQRADELEALGDHAAAEAGFARSAAGFARAEGLLSPDAANALNRLAALRDARGAHCTSGHPARSGRRSTVRDKALASSHYSEHIPGTGPL